MARISEIAARPPIYAATIAGRIGRYLRKVSIEA
jgi:hypothetical protein